MSAGDIRVLVQLDDPSAAEVDLDRLTSRVRNELLELDVDAVDRPAAGPVPLGSRAVELAAIGALLVTVQQGWDVVDAVVERLRSWASRDPGRTVKITIDGDTIEVTGASDESERRLIDSWAERRRGRGAGAEQA